MYRHILWPLSCKQHPLCVGENEIFSSKQELAGFHTLFGLDTSQFYYKYWDFKGPTWGSPQKEKVHIMGNKWNNLKDAKKSIEDL